MLCCQTLYGRHFGFRGRCLPLFFPPMASPCLWCHVSRAGTHLVSVGKQGVNGDWRDRLYSTNRSNNSCDTCVFSEMDTPRPGDCRDVSRKACMSPGLPVVHVEYRA